MIKYQEIKCKSILTKTRLPESDYVINPYAGCSMGCVYCYARFMKRFTNHTEPWGAFVDIKTNAVEVLEKEIKTAKKGTVLLSSVTDPYQAIEGRYQLTRKLLGVLLRYQFPVSILTKSALVTRDMDLFKQFKVDVGMTVTGLDDKAKALFEPHASTHKMRIEALKKLHDNGIKTYAFIGPILPFFTDIQKLFSELKGIVNMIWLESLNTQESYWIGIESVLKKNYPELLPKYKEIFFTDKRKQYLKELRKETDEMSREHNIETKLFIHD